MCSTTDVVFFLTIRHVDLSFLSCSHQCQALEVVADRQKSAFRLTNAYPDQWISSGVWNLGSRQPNYLGECTLWLGLFVTSSQSFDHVSELLSVIAPIWTYFLLSRVSGVPMLEAAARKKWGKDPKFHAFLARTWPIMIKLW